MTKTEKTANSVRLSNVIKNDRFSSSQAREVFIKYFRSDHRHVPFEDTIREGVHIIWKRWNKGNEPHKSFCI